MSVPNDMVARWGASGERFVALPQVLYESRSELGLRAVDLVLLAVLVSHQFRPDGLVYPTYKTIAEKSGLSRRTIIDRLNELKRRGLVEIERRHGHSNLYTWNGLIRELCALEQARRGAARALERSAGYAPEEEDPFGKEEDPPPKRHLGGATDAPRHDRCPIP